MPTISSSAKDVFARMQKHLNIGNNNSELFRIWNINRTSYDNWARKDKVPLEKILEFSAKFDINYEYLRTGVMPELVTLSKDEYEKLKSSAMLGEIINKFNSLSFVEQHTLHAQVFFK